LKLASKLKQSILVLIPLLLALYLFWPKDEYLPLVSVEKQYSKKIGIEPEILNTNFVLVNRDVTVERYFQYIDSIVTKYDSLTPYKLSEHLLVRSNPWIIDTLENTDYYRMIVKDSFVYNQKKMIVLPKDARIVVPDSIQAEKLFKSFQQTLIDINIPEFKLRILEDSIKLFEFPIRVGRDEKKYLSMAGRTLDLKTKTGKGTIVSYERNPDYYNPADGHRYYTTHRDDNELTALPQIPFLVPEINGLLLGQLIHPTTNPKTLGKAYSNGCIGTKEADAWVIYYYAPIGTKVNIRYDLKIKGVTGKDSILKDVYKYYENQ
jgi:hypothetical protein